MDGKKVVIRKLLFIKKMKKKTMWNVQIAFVTLIYVRVSCTTCCCNSTEIIFAFSKWTLSIILVLNGQKARHMHLVYEWYCNYNYVKLWCVERPLVSTPQLVSMTSFFLFLRVISKWYKIAQNCVCVLFIGANEKQIKNVIV